MEKEYNSAFFGLYENTFLVYSQKHGQVEALRFLQSLFEYGLKKAYDSMGFTQGSSADFVRVVGTRDNGVGLKIAFPEVSDELIVYQFHTDPFPNLKGKVDAQALDDTYINFKVQYLLGPDWRYMTTCHLWKGNPYTEHRIFKKNRVLDAKRS